MHEGHRQRMLKRLEHAEDLQDHELLEILLYNAIPRKNTNPLAHELLTAFPSWEELLHASYEELLDVNGIGPETAAYLRCIGELLGRMGEGRESFPVSFSVGSFSEFLCRRLAPLTKEVVEIYSIDAHERVRSCKRFTLSLPDRVQIESGELGRFIAARKPAGIVVAHNHPSAPAHPSAEDDRFTAQVQLHCSVNGIRLYDHIIIGRGGDVYSYFLVGRLEGIRRNFNVTTIVGEKLYRD